MSRYKLGDLTIKNWNDWDRVVRDPVTVGVMITQGIGYSAAAAGLASGAIVAGFGTAFVGYLAVTAVTSWALSALTPKQDFGSVGSSGIMVNLRDPAAPQDFVYGKVRKGGVVTFAEATGTDNVFLHQVIVLAGHEVNSIGDIYINDQLATLSGEYVTTSGSGAEQTNWQRKIRIRKHKGDQTTADSTLTSGTSLGSSFIGNDMAYLYVRYEYDQTVFANGLPLITAVVEGKKVYDPRTSTTAYSANAALCIRDFLVSEYGLDDSSIDDTDFQAAANICDEDIRMNTIVSAGNFIVGKQYEIKTVGSTDFTAIGASANTVGVVFTATGAGSNNGDAYDSENRYEINGVVQANRPIGNVLQDMVTACAGTLYWGMGSWKLKVGAYSTYVKTLTLDDLRGPLSIETRINMRDNFNRVTGTFNDAANKWITADYPELTTTTPAGSFVTGQTYAITSLGTGTDFTAIGASSNTVGVVFKATGAGTGTGAASIFLGEDNGEKAALDLPLPFTTSAAMAQRLAKLTLLRGREQMTMTAEFGMEAFELEVGDIVRFSEENPTTGAVQYRYGFGSQNSGTGKEFEVVAWKLSANQDAGDLRIAMTLREISSDAFSWSAEEQAIVANNADVSKLSQVNQNKKAAIVFQNGLDLLVDAVNPQVSLVSAGSFVSGNSYTIVSTSTNSGTVTDYTAIGADNNDIGTTFTATGVGTGTGTAYDNTTYSSVQDQITISFKAANPQLSHMSEIPENQVVFAKFTNNSDSDQSALKIWDYDRQLWLEETDDNYIIQGLSNEIVTNDAVLGYIQSASISAQQLNVNDTIDFGDGGAIRINRDTYDFLPSTTSDQAKGGLFLGNPAGSGADGTSTNAFYALSSFGIKNSTELHGVEFTPTDTKIINPTITKTAQGFVQSADLQSTQTITIKDGSTNPNAVSLTVNAVGGGGGGAAAVTRSTAGADGTSTIYYLILDGVTQSNVAANGGAGGGTNDGVDKWRGDNGAASAYAAGGVFTDSTNGDGGAGSLGSGGAGGSGRPNDFNITSKKGGAGGGHGTLSTTTYDISSYSTVSLVLSQIGSGGSGGTGTRGDGGDGGTGVVKYNIFTSGPEEVLLETQSGVQNLTLGFDQTWSNPTRSTNTSYTNTTNKPIQVQVMALASSGGTSYFEVSTDNLTWVIVSGISDHDGRSTFGGIVPPAHYYRVRIAGGGLTVLVWAELS